MVIREKITEGKRRDISLYPKIEVQAFKVK